MKPQVTKESLALWIAELESQPHLSLREERYLAVMKYANSVFVPEDINSRLFALPFMDRNEGEVLLNDIHAWLTPILLRDEGSE